VNRLASDALQRATLLAGLALLLLTGCYRGSSTADPAALAGAVLPLGVLPSTYAGVVPAFAPWANGCCWLEKQAMFQTDVPTGATKLLIRVAIPDSFPGRDKGQQSVTLGVDGATKAFDHLGVGVFDLRVPLNVASRPRVLAVNMRMGLTFVDPDGRVLSLILVRVMAR